MDIKIQGLDRSILENALQQAKEGRLHILQRMLETLPASRTELNEFAPRIVTIKVRPDQIRIVIGSGGKTIKGITEQTGATINIEDDGTVAIASENADAVQRAIEIIKSLVEEPEVGKVYKGTVRRIVDFGAFVEIIPNTEALLHVSEIAHTRTERVEDVLKEGEEIEVKVLSMERDGKIRLSRRALLPVPEGMEVRPPSTGGGGGGGGDRPRGDRDRGRGGGGGDRRDRPRRG
jgi:polyribonucleotide nucleotidyltransferase